MSTTIHIPAIRQGVPYRSVDTLTTTGAIVSQVNSGLIRRDLLAISRATAELEAIPTPQLLGRRRCPSRLACHRRRLQP